jgi:2-polyprenyl-3-methyl-5-hydroxy-6-metoxy-1,4-benzoquinol methylase
MTISYELASCPVCGNRNTETIATAEDVRAEVEALWQFHLARRVAGVPTRQLFDRAFFSQHAPLRIVRCVECGTLYRDPREKERSLLETYAGDDPEEPVLAGLLAAQQSTYRAQAKRLARLGGHAGTGIELGSYVGGFLAAAHEEHWSFTGVDVNESVNEFARAHGFNVVTGTLEDAPCGPFDAVAIWNCFDQLADPRGTLRAARERLRPGGTLAVRVPNGACYARLREHRSARALLAWNNLLAFPYRQGFTPASLARLVSTEGFRVVAIRADSLARIGDRFTKRWAKMEEYVVKGLLKAYRPWLELFAVKRS